MESKTLRLNVAFPVEDLELGFGILKKGGIIPEGATLDYFTEGDFVKVNMAEIDKDSSPEICVALMAALICGKTKLYVNTENVFTR